MNPFIGLVVKQPGRLPTTESFTRVIQGKRVAGSEYVAPQQAAAPLTEDDKADLKADKKQAARERELAYYRARYQRLKDTPEHKAKVAAWREADREAMRKRIDDWAKANPERRQEIDRSYRMRNLEKVRARMAEASRRHHEKNRDEINAKKRAYYEKNRDKINAQRRAARLAKQQET